MTPADAKAMVPDILLWLDQDRNWLVPHEFLRLGESFAKAGLPGPALKLARALLSPHITPVPEPSEWTNAEAQSYTDHHIFEQTIERLVPLLMDIRPWHTVRLLESLLRSAISLERSQGSVSYSFWRSAVEDNTQNWARDSYKDKNLSGPPRLDDYPLRSRRRESRPLDTSPN